jgi:hypothetical protein
VENCGKFLLGITTGASRRGEAAAMTMRAHPDGPSVQACSACAGDYEDPERTARGEEEAGDEHETANGDPGRGRADEFPVQRD